MRAARPVPQPGHAPRVIAPVGPQSRRGGETLVRRGVLGSGEKPPADDSQPRVVIRELRLIGVEPLQACGSYNPD